MNSTSIRRRLVPAVAALALAVSVTACAAGNESDAGGGDGGGDAVTLDGGGASSQEKAQDAWRAGFQDEPRRHGHLRPGRLGHGRENFITGAYVFAGTDSYLNDDEGELTAAKEQCGGDPIEVPAYVSPIAVALQPRGRRRAQPVGRDHRRHLQRHHHQVERRRDRRRQPRRRPSGHRITPVHRSDDSGTTENFTDYLARPVTAPGPTEADGLWPEDGIGEGREGTSGVSAVISDGAGAIGYADASAVTRRPRRRVHRRG